MIEKKPVKRVDLVDAVVERIVETIKNGDYSPGARLPSIQELSEILEVGRSSVREALKQLQIVGVVEVKQGKGVFIKERIDTDSLSERIGYLLSLRKPDILHLLEARKIVERGTAKLAAKKASPEEIEKLEQIIRKMEKTMDNPEDFARVNVSFHVTIARASKNPILPVFFNSIYDIFLREQQVVAELLNIAPTSVEYHTRIWEAIKKKDPEGAAKKMVEHLNFVEKAILKNF